MACLDDSPNACARAGECATLVLWERLSRAINETVDGMTLADLAEIQRAKAGNGLRDLKNLPSGGDKPAFSRYTNFILNT